MDKTVKQLEHRINNLEKRILALEEHLIGFYPYRNPLDDILPEAIKIAKQHDMVSASLFQRRLFIGYARAARILDQLEEKGIVGPGEGAKPRKVLV